MSCQALKVLVTPHHLGGEGLESTVRAIEGLPGGHVVQASCGNPLLEDGRLVVMSWQPEFLVYAVTHQGYAKAAEICKPK